MVEARELSDGWSSAVSRETMERLKIYEELLIKWGRVKNLVGPSTLQHIWERHFRDSLQIRNLAPTLTTWVDLGSGGGLPGLVIAVDLVNTPDAVVHLVEADGRKCAFLREAIRATQAPAVLHHGRIEEVIQHLPQVQAVTARALASMDQLITFSSPLLLRGAHGFFPKGQDYQAELTRLSHDDRFAIDVMPSLTDSRSRIVHVVAKSPDLNDLRSPK